jgi:thiamine biosynthesis lipoprotein
MRVYIDAPGLEAIEAFACFGGVCSVRVTGRGRRGSARQAALWAKSVLLEWHAQFSRFDPQSELSRLNRDPRTTVPVSPNMASFVAAALLAAEATGGLVDPTLVSEIEHAGYDRHFDQKPLPLAAALADAPTRSPARPRSDARWRQVSVDLDAGTVSRPPAVRLDSGGLAKGLFADLLAVELDDHQAFAIDAAGDIRFGGVSGTHRPIQVADPFGGPPLHTFQIVRGAAATSAIGRRSWRAPDGSPAHHLLNPATGEPAFTGLVQVTALAPTAAGAEALSKAALLSGPDQAASWLSHGGLIVGEDGLTTLVEPVRADDEISETGR